MFLFIIGLIGSLLTTIFFILKNNIIFALISFFWVLYSLKLIIMDANIKTCNEKIENLEKQLNENCKEEKDGE